MTNPRRAGYATAFLRRIKDLRKKHRQIQDDVNEFVSLLKNGETPGDLLQGTGDYVVYKARIASRDMQRGKSGGFRIVYYLRTETHVLLLTIYPKTERDNLSSIEVLYLIKEALQELAEEDADSSPDTDALPAE